jgi:hypothetical protein
MALKDMSAPENEDLKLKYGIIVAKLRAAIVKNKAAFPELTLLGVYLDKRAPQAGEQDYLGKLEGLCAYLQGLSSSSYIIRHLHHHLCADVEAAKSNSAFFNQSKDYIEVPE